MCWIYCSKCCHMTFPITIYSTLFFYAIYFIYAIYFALWIKPTNLYPKLQVLTSFSCKYFMWLSHHLCIMFWNFAYWPLSSTCVPISSFRTNDHHLHGDCFCSFFKIGHTEGVPQYYHGISSSMCVPNFEYELQKGLHLQVIAIIHLLDWPYTS
jgi:hypothetical protein